MSIMVAAPDPADIETVQSAALAAMQGSIPPVKVGAGYRLGLLAVAMVMLILPLLYVALICLAGYAVLWYAVHGTAVLKDMSHSSARGALVAYIGPLIVGSVIVAFMIKPLFAKRAQRPATLTLSRSEQRILYTFVGKLCKIIGAPEPTRIDVNCQVNASAGFREGLIGFLKGELVLTIGLPLAAGMTLRELAGVLAHEFGHFAQGTGMRLTFIVRSINAWFARVVYERDAWDQALLEAARGKSHVVINLIAWLARAAVWGTRRILWVFMAVGHFVSSFMLRQMEFDADRYEARIAGSDSFAAASERIAMLSVACSVAFNDLGDAWREKRLCDDLARLIVAREGAIPGEVRRAVQQHSGARKTGWFDSHPCDTDRIRSATAEQASGIFDLPGPANILFADFEGLSRRATQMFYRLNLGRHFSPSQVVATDTLVSEVGEQNKGIDSLSRFFQGLLHPVCPVFPRREVEAPADPEALAERILEARRELTNARRAAADAAAMFLEADERLLGVLSAQSIRRVTAQGGNIRMADFGLPEPCTDENLRAGANTLTAIRNATLEKLNGVLRSAMSRIEIMVASDERDRKVKRSAAVASGQSSYNLADTAAPDDAIRLALDIIRMAAPRIDQMRREYVALGGLLSLVKSEGNTSDLVSTVLGKSRSLHGLLHETHAQLRQAAYPYEHTERGATISRFALVALPSAEDVGGVFRGAASTIEAVYALYVRIMGDLARRAEAFEQSLGLEPLPAPPQHAKQP